MQMEISRISLMAIINITDNSYYSASRFLANGGADIDAVRRRVRQVLDEGADIIDFGACSTRPGSEAVGADEEWRRLEPVLRLMADEFPGVEVSVDTYWADVVRKAHKILPELIVNDISAGEDDPQMLPTVGELGLRYIAMHKRGNPGNMQSLCDYPEGVTQAVLQYFRDFAIKAEHYGIKDWILDPGFGFAKTVEQNWQMLRELGRFKELGRPILVGISRKSMIYKPLGLGPEDVLPQTCEAHRQAIANGATILRVHDVAPARQVADQAAIASKTARVTYITEA